MRLLDRHDLWDVRASSSFFTRVLRSQCACLFDRQLTVSIVTHLWTSLSLSDVACFLVLNGHLVLNGLPAADKPFQAYSGGLVRSLG